MESCRNSHFSADVQTPERPERSPGPENDGPAYRDDKEDEQFKTVLGQADHHAVVAVDEDAASEKSSADRDKTFFVIDALAKFANLARAG